MATKAKILADVRAKKGRDMSPRWDGAEDWDAAQFTKHFRVAMEYYRLEHSAKELKPKVVEWMKQAGWHADSVAEFKKTKDNRCSGTMGGVASCLLRGMPEVHQGFNEGRDTAKWLENEINKVIVSGKNDRDDEEEEGAEVKPAVAQPTIQERVKEAAMRMTEELEDAIESFQVDPENFDPKAFKVLNLLKGKEVKAAHARIIKGFYERNLNELLEVPGTKDEQLKEAYKHLSKNNLKKITAFYQEIDSACTMLMQEAKVNRAPRKTKAVSKDKVVSKLKYMKTFESLKLVSINPVDIIGSKELWIYNTKSRKLGRYTAAEYHELGVKGTSITGFSEANSIQKTLRKPEDKLKEFKAAGKVALRKFLEDINAVDTKLNGRINEEIILLKVQ